jgi:beta-lactamase class A
VNEFVRLRTTEDPALTRAVIDALDASGLRAIGHAVVIDLDSMTFGSWRGDDDIYPASVVKVPIMAEAFRRYSDGSLDPESPVTISASNLTTTWGESPFAAHSVSTVGALVERMITHSDNVATNQLIDVLRRERVTLYMHELGLPTFLLGRKLSGSEPLVEDVEMVGRNRLPPMEIATLLALIATDRVEGAAAQREIMRRCVDDEKLVPGLRPGDRFMHKTGETGDHSHDAGILETADGRRHVIVLYTTPEPKPDGTDADHVDPQITEWMREIRTSL